jgi:sugar/nucleoside kinase (ribokinase family)
VEPRRVDLLVAGDVNPDVLVVDPDPTPVFGQVERMVRDIRLTMGGSSSIMACGAARLGLSVAFCGVVGDDEAGRSSLALLQARGVDTSPSRVDPTTPTAVTVVLAREDDRAILTSLGTIGALRAADIPSELVARARHLHVGSTALQPRLREGLPEIFRHARASGTTTSFDANWDPDERWDDLDPLLATADVCFPNLAEGRRWTGLVEPEEVARGIVARATAAGRSAEARPLTVALKLGADGAIAGLADEVVRVSAPRVTVVDTTGAGDSFDAGFVTGMLHGWSLERTLALAVACGSLSTRAIGGVDAQPTFDEAMALVG